MKKEGEQQKIGQKTTSVPALEGGEVEGTVI